VAFCVVAGVGVGVWAGGVNVNDGKVGG
jgi:hypothetical protein